MELYAFGCGHHPIVAATYRDAMREYARVAEIRDEMEKEGRFKPILAIERRDEENKLLGPSAAWFECMDLVHDEYCERYIERR